MEADVRKFKLTYSEIEVKKKLNIQIYFILKEKQTEDVLQVMSCS